MIDEERPSTSSKLLCDEVSETPRPSSDGVADAARDPCAEMNSKLDASLEVFDAPE